MNEQRDCHRWQVIKNGIPIGVYRNIEEAEAAYLDFDADEIVDIDSDDPGLCYP